VKLCVADVCLVPWLVQWYEGFKCHSSVLYPSKGRTEYVRVVVLRQECVGKCPLITTCRVWEADGRTGGHTKQYRINKSDSWARLRGAQLSAVYTIQCPHPTPPHPIPYIFGACGDSVLRAPHILISPASRTSISRCALWRRSIYSADRTVTTRTASQTDLVPS